ncbi:hypothetical protein ACH5RR_034246 [Cinchona calisaya]|uniref:Uncharacterized protein n=1 Tax=Cinchona calisaya TaxID=153742 RepID=A0ABD2YDY4_9GENT
MFTQGVASQVYELKRAIALLQQEKSSISSYHVWETYHTKSHCFKVIGYASDWRKPGKQSDMQTRSQGDHKVDAAAPNTSSRAAFTVTTDGVSLPIRSLTFVQHQQLMALLGGTPTTNMAASNCSGLTFEDADWSG